jgi:prophage antirepressor-like protein
MSNELVPSGLNLSLSYDDKHVRVVGSPDAPEWVAADVCDVLGIANPSDATKSLDPDERGLATVYTPQGPGQEMLTVTEAGLYRLILVSRKPAAKKFKRWVLHEVLPAIRRYGCYPPPELPLWDNRAIVTVDADKLAVGLSRALAPIMEPLVTGQTILHQKCSELAESQERLERGQKDLSDRMGNLERRREPKRADKRRHTVVVWKCFGGKCPCCGKLTIVDHEGNRNERAQFDHWRLPSENSIALTWLVCDECNARLRDGDERAKREIRFKHYQDVRREYEDSRQLRLPGMEDNR